MLKYHTSLHHSQTWVFLGSISRCLSTIHLYIILKLCSVNQFIKFCLSTIHLYIILKQCYSISVSFSSLSTIHLYIILKPNNRWYVWECSLSTIHLYIILKPQIQKWNAIIRIRSMVLCLQFKFHIHPYL